MVYFLFIEGLTPAEFCMKLLVTIKSEMESVRLSCVPETSLIIFIKSWSWINDWINEWNLHSYSNFHLHRTARKLESKKKNQLSFQIKNSIFAKQWVVTDIYYLLFQEGEDKNSAERIWLRECPIKEWGLLFLILEWKTAC